MEAGQSADPGRDERREAAVARLKKKSDFKGHVMVYVAVNVFLVVIWVVTGSGFFWPVFPIVGWGIGVFFNWWDVYVRKGPSEEQIQREMRSME